MGRRYGWFAKHHGGDMVPNGTYWSLRSLKLNQVMGTIDFLPCKRDVTYLRLPGFMVPPVALAQSLLYILALSLAPIIILGWLASRTLAGAFRHARGWRVATNWNWRGLQ